MQVTNRDSFRVTFYTTYKVRPAGAIERQQYSNPAQQHMHTYCMWHLPMLLLQVVENLVVNEVYVLYHCGTPRPTQIPAGAKLMEIPLRSVSADDSSALEYMVGYQAPVAL